VYRRLNYRAVHAEHVWKYRRNLYRQQEQLTEPFSTCPRPLVGGEERRPDELLVVSEDVPV
jgi:hypothetical protein